MEKIDGVPQEDNVEAIFPIFPDFPIPEITIVPLQPIIKSIHFEKFKSYFF